MPSSSLHIRRIKNAPRKKIIIVSAAIASSALGRYHRLVAEGSGIPMAERPRACRMTLSKRSRAAARAGELLGDSTDNAVAVEGIGGCKCVARNIW